MDAHARKDPEGYFLNCMDPGGDTGMSLFHIKPEKFRLVEFATVAWRPRQGSNPTATFVGWRLEYPGVHHFLYEGFHVRNTDSAAGTDTTALEVIGAMEQVMFDRGEAMYEKVFSQEPVAVKREKGLATDAVLESLGLHLGHHHHQRHVRDANRHAVVHLANRRYRPVCEAAYPRRAVRNRPLPLG